MKEEFSEEKGEEFSCSSLFLDAIGTRRLLTHEEETALGKRIAEGDLTARNELCDANYRLVVKLAKNYTYSGLEFDDLVQAGNMGLIKAADRFDYRLGFKFSTYAVNWILQSIRRTIADTGRTIRIPVHMQETVAKLNKVVSSLSQKLGRDPTLEEIAEAAGCTKEKVLDIYALTPDPVSLDEPIGDDDDSDLYFGVRYEDDETPEESLVKASLRGEMEKAFGLLTDRETDVIKLRSGWDDGEVHTLEDIAGRYGITRERVRQIEALAMKKLRHAGALKAYLAA